jgi:hypothetical protein
MVDTKVLARKILAGLSDPVVNNEVWLRDVLDEAFKDAKVYADKLERDVWTLEKKVAELELELNGGGKR